MEDNVGSHCQLLIRVLEFIVSFDMVFPTIN